MSNPSLPGGYNCTRHCERAVRRPARITGRAVGSARQRLRGFRYASILALTGLLLLLFAPTDATAPVDLTEAQERPEASAADTPERPTDIEELVPHTAGELRTAFDNVVSGFLRNLHNEILTGTVVNLTKDFPYVWNELEFMLAAETDIDYALAVLGRLADDVLKEQMQVPAMRYETILKARGLEASVPQRPQLYVSLVDDGLSVTVRYLVDARRRRIKQSELVRRIFAELQKSEHAGRIVGYHPRRLMQVIDEQGRPVPVGRGTS
jgi:hypothetical protein